jgi:hypothetical protein
MCGFLEYNEGYLNFWAVALFRTLTKDQKELFFEGYYPNTVEELSQDQKLIFLKKYLESNEQDRK